MSKPEPTRLKIAWTTEVPTDKGHKRNRCAEVGMDFDSLADAEQFSALCIGFLDELLKQYNTRKTGATRIIVPGAHAV